MKKRFIYFIVLISALFLFLIYPILSQDVPTGVVPGAGSISQEKMENITDQFDKANEWRENITENQAARDYLKTELKKALLNNPFIKSMNDYFERNTLFFRIVFGMDYSLSLTLFFVIIIWFVTFLKLPDLIKGKKKILGREIEINEILAWIFSLIITMLLAFLQVFYLISRLFIQIMFFNENSFIRIVIFILLILVIVIYYKFLSNFSRDKKLQEKKNAEEETKLHQEELKKITEGIMKANEE
jgi:hypothetical protein